MSQGRPPAASSPALRSAAAFVDAIDNRYSAEQSVVCRYRGALRLAAEEGDDHRLKELVQRTSLREGLRVFPLLRHRGVSIDVLDETSLMRTRTLKSIDGCVTTAHCLLRGYRRVVFESGGNTGTALTVYGGQVGLETFFFAPAENLPLLDAAPFRRSTAHVIAVEDPREVKRAAEAFAARNHLTRIPELAWRHQASSFIGCFLLEHLLQGEGYDVLAQSISAAFGPVGIYRILSAHRRRLGALPRFLGVQQAANCPMVRAWRASLADPAAREVPVAPVRSTTGLLAKVMYDGAPHTYGTFDDLRRILVETGGDLTTIDGQDFLEALSVKLDGTGLLKRLEENGLQVTLRDGEVLEKAGLMALVGTLREIVSGRIAPGNRVLVCVTGGTSRPDGRATPDLPADGLVREATLVQASAARSRPRRRTRVMPECPETA